jgi:hypothetical protein
MSSFPVRLLDEDQLLQENCGIMPNCRRAVFNHYKVPCTLQCKCKSNFFCNSYINSDFGACTIQICFQGSKNIIPEFVRNAQLAFITWPTQIYSVSDSVTANCNTPTICFDSAINTIAGI